MSRLLSEQEYRKTKAFKIKRWYRGEKDPYLGTVELKPQTPFQEDVETAKQRTHDEAMVRRMIYDIEHNKKLAVFRRLYRIVSVFFVFVLLGISYRIFRLREMLQILIITRLRQSILRTA